MQDVTQLAGRLALPAVIAHLAAQRPVFHSEADFQFAFGQAVAALDDRIDIRLEVPRRAENRRTYVDLVCRDRQEVSFVEFKYVTRTWSGTDGRTEEPFELRAHEALDLARLHFIHDVTRLEGWTAEKSCGNAFAVLLTNDNRLWEPPTTDRATRDGAFRLHEGRELGGPLAWGTPDAPFERNDRSLRGKYVASWLPYSHLDSRPGGSFRSLGWAISG